MLENDPPALFLLAAVRSPKNTEFPLAAILTKSITLLFGVFPPPQTALTPFETAPAEYLPENKSPKSSASPRVDISI